MTCPKCNAVYGEGAKFCGKCGTPLISEAVIPEQTTERTDVSEKNRADRPTPPKSPDSGMINSFAAVFFCSFLCMEVLPYLIKSFLMLLRKDFLSSSAVALIDIFGFAAAISVLYILVLKKTQKKKIFSSAAFISMLFCESSISSSVAYKINFSFSDEVFPWLIVSAAVKLVFAGLMVLPLSKIVSSEENFHQKGLLLSSGLLLGMLLSETFAGYLMLVRPISENISFMRTFSVYLIKVLIQTFFVYLASCRLIRRQTKKEKSRGKILSFPAAAVIAVMTIGVWVLDLGNYRKISVCQMAIQDSEYYAAECETYFGYADMPAALVSAKKAALHIDAWKTVSGGGTIGVPDDKNDVFLEYLYYLGKDTKDIQHKVITDAKVENMDMWAPLLIEKYREDENIKENEKNHLMELLQICISQEVFVREYPTREEITDADKDIQKALISSDDFDIRVKAVERMAAFEKGNCGIYDVIKAFNEAAEAIPDDMVIQYMSAYFGCTNRWDGANHYDDTAKSVLRFRELWKKEFGKTASDETLKKSELCTADMLISIQKYDNAAEVLEEYDRNKPNDPEVVKKLALCYSNSDDTEKAYQYNKKMFENKTADASTIHVYCISALKSQNYEDAVEAASVLADMVVKSSDIPNECDTYLMQIAHYFVLNDSASWTDYQYSFFGNNMDPELAEMIHKNEFLETYLNALYQTKVIKDNEAALEYTEKALKMQERSCNLNYIKGMILYQMNNYEESLKSLQRADELFPDDPSTLFLMATVYDALGEYQNAYNICLKLDTLYPNGTDHSDDWYGVSAHYTRLKERLEDELKEENRS